MSNERNVGIWIRVSTEDQARGESPENHRLRAEAYAESRGWNVAKTFDLSGVSGKSVMKHPECQRMLAAIRNGKIDALVFSKLARLARNTRELLDFADMFKEANADLISLSEAIDTSTPAGRLFFTMIAAMAQWEREEIVERVNASIPIRAKQGKHLSGVAPFGYRWDNHDLKLVESEAAIRALMYELFLKEKRLKTVAGMLNERGYRTRKGSEFSDTTLKRLLTDPMSKGLRRSNYTTTRSGSGMADRYKDEEEWEWHPCQAIVDEATWDATQAIFAERATKAVPAKKTVRLFSGIVRCACGERMYVRTKTRKYDCPVCHNKIVDADLEGIFVEQLKSFFFSEEEIAKYMQTFDSEFADKERQLSSLEAERLKLQTQIDGLFKLHESGEIPTKGFGDRYRPLQLQIEQIDQETPRLQAAIDVQKIGHQNRDYVIHEARDLYSNWSGLEHATKRSIIETITDEIIVGDEDIEIRLSYVPEGRGEDFESPHTTALTPPQSDRKKATHSQGFIAVINWNRAG